jgi:hypothetical protein
MAERIETANEGRTSDIAYKAIHEQEEGVTVAPVCRAFSSFWAPKGHYRTTTRRMKDNGLKIEDYLQIQTSTNFYW